MIHLWWLWLRHRWRGAGAIIVAALTLMVVALMALGHTHTGVSFLGDTGAARPAAAGSPSDAILPRSGMPLVSALDTPLPLSAGPHSVAEAQAAWSAEELAQRQGALLAAVNCARVRQGQRALMLNPALSMTAGDAWLTLVHDPSWSLIQLPGAYALRGVVSLNFTAPAPATATSCTIGGVEGETLAASADAHTIGIAVFPPRASWDAASAVVLVR